MNNEILYQVALSQVKGIGPLVAKNLISYCGSAKAVFDTPLGKLSKIPGVGNKLISFLKTGNTPALAQADEIVTTALKQNIQILIYTDKLYPYRLKQIADGPNILYYKGSANLQANRCIAIVGTRKASSYGKDVLNKLLEAWQAYQPTIISGLAYGIDITAHKKALDLGLPTIGVMATGLDSIYPQAHQRYAQQMLEQGGLLTEYPFGTKPDAYNFPARNRIIAGISQATIVIEAAIKGGALITANLARDYDREVYATPGSLYNEVSAGCHKIITEQVAQLLYKPEQLIEDLGWTAGEAIDAQTELPDFSSLTTEQRNIAELLQKQPEGIHIDNLVIKSGLAFSTLSTYLLELEFSGWVRALPGKKYQLVRK